MSRTTDAYCEAWAAKAGTIGTDMEGREHRFVAWLIEQLLKRGYKVISPAIAEKMN